jgi:hypothetical protein
MTCSQPCCAASALAIGHQIEGLTGGLVAK